VNLTIGLLQHDAGWELLLKQIGVSWNVYDASQTMSPDAFAVMIVNAEPTSMQRNGLIAFVEAGGAIMADNGGARFFLDCKHLKKNFTSLGPRECAPFSPATILDLFSGGPAIMQNGDRKVEGSSAVQIISKGDGTVVSVPFTVSRLLLSTESKRKNFYAAPDRLPSETVSTVAKGALRQMVTLILEFLHHRRSLPFVHTWYYPGGHPSLFTFRVDSDLGNETELQELYQVCAQHSIPCTWFIDVKSHERWLNFFSSFTDQEIALHCYEHKTGTVRDDVFENFSLGYRLLHEAGHSVTGAAAPCGTWNTAVDTVYRELNMTYSSEFSLDYDDLPFYPVIGEAESPVLQLPIHPICVGSMKRSGYTSQQMREYFRSWTRNRIASREPVCLYHHPTHHHWEVFEDIFSFVNELKIPKLSYSAYASWWRRRIAVTPRFLFDNGTITVPGDLGMDSDLYYRIALPGNKEIISKIDDSLVIAETPQIRRNENIQIPEDILRARKYDPRHPLINFLDYWYKTTQ
jgi:hypothetical protein